MRIVFIAPAYGNIYGPFHSALKVGFLNPPLGLCYLAASLRKAGHKVKIIDSEAEGLSLQGIVKEVKSYAPGLVGITATSPEFFNACIVAKALKDSLSVPVVIGGVHVSIMGREILEKNPCFDFGAIGESEETIVELVNSIEGENGFETIKGLIYRREGAAIIQNNNGEPKMNLDDIPFPARDLLDNKRYFRSIPRRGYVTTTAFISSRGCPFHCIYCAIDRIPGANRIRFRSPENVVDEIELIVNKMGVRHIAFNDDVLTLDKERIIKICEEILKRKLKFTWEGLSRADTVDEELLILMKRAGFIRISFGIESGNPEILKMIRKGQSHEQLRIAFMLAKKAGIITRGSVIIGLPYETIDTVNQTAKFVKQLYGLDQLILNISTPYPGTKLREMVLAGIGGTKLLDSDISSLQRFGNAVLEVNDLTKDDLINLQKKILVSFYLSFSRIFRHLMTYEFRAFVLDGLSFMSSILRK